MRGLFKYLIPFILSVVFFAASDRSVVSVSEAVLFGDIPESIETATNLSAKESVPCLPRQVSFATAVHAQNSARRTDNIQRQNFSFVRSGKVITPDIIFFIQEISRNTYSSLTDPASRLVSLCRFII